VGISFGLDRIYVLMEDFSLFQNDTMLYTKVLFMKHVDDESKYAYDMMQLLRKKGISAELFHEQAKMDKQFKYAEKKNIPFVAITGAREIDSKSVTVKDLRSGEQKTFSLENLSDFLFI
ncbi:MAG: His/Gly/Thr/Pro-type tRNA ligase C-terminal domain-containing protein, partial [Flavisolibacter sp.]